MTLLRAFALALLCLTAPLAGCLGPGQDTGSEEGTRSTQALGEGVAPGGFGFQGCFEVAGSMFLDTEDARALLPPGLEPRVNGGTDDVGLIFGAWTCQATVGEEPIGEVNELYVYMYIEPPEPVRADGVDSYAAIIAAVTDAPEMRDAFQAWGIEHARLGEVTYQVDAPELGGAYQVDAQSPRITLQSTGALAPAGITSGATTLRFVIADEGGTLAGVLDVSVTATPIHTLGATAELEVEIGGQRVEGRPYPGEALTAGHDDWRWEATYVPIEGLTGDEPEQASRSPALDGQARIPLEPTGGL